MTNYDIEAKERWGDTDAYKEHIKKTEGYTEQKLQQINQGLSAILLQFAECKESGCGADSERAQALVKKLQAHINENYYTCTNEILAGLGKMYVADERFKNNIDKNGNGTAELISKAIEIYCK